METAIPSKGRRRRPADLLVLLAVEMGVEKVVEYPTQIPNKIPIDFPFLKFVGKRKVINHKISPLSFIQKIIFSIYPIPKTLPATLISTRYYFSHEPLEYKLKTKRLTFVRITSLSYTK